jgi:hypothetical protein
MASLDYSLCPNVPAAGHLWTITCAPQPWCPNILASWHPWDISCAPVLMLRGIPELSSYTTATVSGRPRAISCALVPLLHDTPKLFLVFQCPWCIVSLSYSLCAPVPQAMSKCERQLLSEHDSWLTDLSYSTYNGGKRDILGIFIPNTSCFLVFKYTYTCSPRYIHKRAHIYRFYLLPSRLTLSWCRFNPVRPLWRGLHALPWCLEKFVFLIRKYFF